MNAVDIVILAILGLSVLVGLYRGFISSVASMGGCLLSLGLSFWLSPKLAATIQSNPDILRTLASYTDAATKLGDQALASESVTTLTENGITEIMNRVSLPAPLSTLLQSNLQNKVYGAAADVGTYVTQTIVGAILNVICFIVCFLALMLVIHFVINFLKVVFKFPVLKQLNSIAGGAFGLIRGALLCFVAFALLPLIQTLLPVQDINQMVEQSALAPLFNSGNLILAIMNGKLF
ncbi:MAG: CvpA family protein [Clostridiales bacterium]|nr:CvpA family protein [Clostridiales bacterium]